MKGIGKTLALAAAIGAIGAPLSSAHAWWGPWGSGGGPGYGLGDMFGLGDMDFGGRTSAYGRGYGHGYG